MMAKLLCAWRRYRIATQVISGLVGLIARHQERRAEIGCATWIYTAYGKFYMRISKRLLSLDRTDNKLMWCIEIASVDIDEQYQRQGLFKTALIAIENHTLKAGYDAVLVENVLNDDLVRFLQRRGYERKPFEPSTYFIRTEVYG